MQRQSTISMWCERIVEGGWLLAVVLIPSYFNLLSSRHFEPDKATTLRAIVLVMLAAAVIRWLDSLGSGPSRTVAAAAGPSLWKRIIAFPMALPVILYTLVFLLATAVSIVPGASFWGSYQRLQGTYTNLSYVTLGLLIVFTMQRREQLDRLIVMLVLGSLAAVGYGLVQHFQIDPLPWKGDVIARVASTMGNSIFVAAYLILVLPFALAKAISAFSEAQRTPASDAPMRDLSWAGTYLLLLIGGLLIIWASIQFGAVVRTSDLRYWWVYPGALLAAGGLFLVPTLRPHANERVGGAIWPGIITLAYVILLAISFVIGQGSGQSVGANPGRPGLEWPFWLIGGLALVLIGYILLFTLAKKNGPPTKLLLQLQGVGMLVIAFTLLAVIFFTQSRGPWIGGLAGLFVFFTVLLALAWRRTRAAGSPQASLWRNLLIGEVVLAIALGGFLVAFNLSNAPFFEQLRTVPYIGRMGKLLEVDDGTGKVRRLIWIGDEQAGGSVALIKSDPIRAIVGWGPESMFVAYNRFYPPSLANIESRGASPDRSHEAYLDELINKGVLGLASYLFVLISVIVLARRLILRSEDWSSQVLLTGCIAVVTAHMVEGFTGIPIVATLMLLWITIAITVMVGKLKGEYSLNARPLVDPTLAAEPTPEPEPRAAGRQNSQRRPSNRARGSGNSTGNNGSGGRGPASTRPARSSNAAAWLVYGLIAIGALAAVWSFNIDNVYADMRFQQGQTYTEDPQADLDRYIIGTSFYLDSVRMEPNQDFYYLNLGRSLMSIVDIRRQTSGVALGQPDPEVRVEDLLRLQEPTDVQSFVLQQSPMMLMSYAEAVLNRAHTINPLNKDHFANLARMYNFWYSRLQRDPAILAKAVDWYKRGVEVAPQDVTILNEYASATALQGNDARSRGDEATANERLAEAARLLARSQQIDPLYRDTPVRAAEILRLQGRYAEAVDNYIVLLAQNPRALDNQIATIIDSLRSKPELLLKLRSAYDAAIQRKPDDVGSIALVGLISARAGDLPRAAQAFTDVVRLQPNNLEARQNYTLVLSDMLQYRQAAGEAEVLLRLAQQQGATQQEQSALESLLGFMRQKVSGQ